MANIETVKFYNGKNIRIILRRLVEELLGSNFL